MSSALSEVVPYKVISNPSKEVFRTDVVGEGVAIEGAPEGAIDGDDDGALEKEGGKEGGEESKITEDGAALACWVGARDGSGIVGGVVWNMGRADGEAVAFTKTVGEAVGNAVLPLTDCASIVGTMDGTRLPLGVVVPELSTGAGLGAAVVGKAFMVGVAVGIDVVPGTMVGDMLASPK